MSSIRKSAVCRIVAVLATITALFLAPGDGTLLAQCVSPAVSHDASAGCGGCCDTVDCCASPLSPAKTPTAPASVSPDGTGFSIALMAASRPRVGLLPAREHDFVPSPSVAHRCSPDSLALLCVRLI